MNLVAKASGGPNIVARPQARANWYPVATVRPAQVAVYWRYENEPAAAARLIGVYAPGQEVSIPFNPLEDRNIILSTISIAADGTRSVREISDAHEELLIFQRETAAPVVTLVGNATHTLLTLAIDGFSALAIKRKVRIADDSGMTTGLVVRETVLSPGEVLPRVIYIDRADSGTGARTIYIRVSHSSGGNYGAESTAAPFTYADNTGSGGDSGGDGDPFGGGRYDT